MAVDGEQGHATTEIGDDVGVPNLVEQRLRGHGVLRLMSVRQASTRDLMEIFDPSDTISYCIAVSSARDLGIAEIRRVDAALHDKARIVGCEGGRLGQDGACSISSVAVERAGAAHRPRPRGCVGPLHIRSPKRRQGGSAVHGNDYITRLVATSASGIDHRICKDFGDEFVSRRRQVSRRTEMADVHASTPITPH